ncbi:immunoglobulin-like domain-containing protein [Gracilibacillus sp. Marseille-QA3620]
MRRKGYFIVTGLALIFSLLASGLLIPSLANAATDKVKPTISGATNTVAYLNHTFDPRKGVTAKDNVDGNITSIIKISGKVNTKKLGKYTLTYKVMDSAKNTCTVKRIITVKKDTTKPKIIGATNKTVYMGYSFNPKAGVKATDNAAGNLTSQIKVSGKVNTKKVGKYKLTYTVTDKAKNTSKVTRAITVKKDTTKPKITGATNNTVYKGYSFNPKTGVTASDNVDGNITSKIKISGKVNVNEVGIYKLKYSVEDKTKNETTVTRTITVKKDTTKPKITGASNITINYGTSFDPKKGVKATDNLDGTITNWIKITGTVNPNKVGTYKLTYAVKDKTGNRTTVTRLVHVVDKMRPILTGVSNTSIAFGKSFNPLSGIRARDAVDGDLTAKIKVEGKVNVNKIGIYTLKYTVKDKSGNITNAVRKVSVIDNIGPTIKGIGDIELQYFDEFDPLEGVSVIDNVDGDLTSKIKVYGKVDTSDLSSNGYGHEIITYKVTDKAGNITTKTRNVRITYRQVKFECFDKGAINLGEKFSPYEGVRITDVASGKDITSYFKIINSVNENRVGIYSVQYIFTGKMLKVYGDWRHEFSRKVTVVDLDRRFD